MSRLALILGFDMSGCILGHQSLELYIKGIIRVSGESKKS